MGNAKIGMLCGALLASLFANGWQLTTAVKEKQLRQLNQSQHRDNGVDWQLESKLETIAKQQMEQIDAGATLAAAHATFDGELRRLVASSGCPIASQVTMGNLLRGIQEVDQRQAGGMHDLGERSKRDFEQMMAWIAQMKTK